MAIEAKLTQDKDKDEGAGSPSVMSQTAGGGATAQGAAPSPTANRTPSKGPNIQSYIRANQGAGNQLASSITNQFGKQTGQFGQQVNKAQNQLTNQTSPLEQKLGSEGQNLIQTSFKNPNDILNNQSQLTQFQALRDRGYAGDIQNVQSAAANTQNQLGSQLTGLKQGAQNAATEAGRFQLLRNTFGQPSYTQGQQKLDQLFLQAQPSSARNLQTGLNQQVNRADQTLNAAQAQANARLNALNQMSNQRSQDIQNLFLKGNEEGKGIQGIESDVTANLANLQNQASTYGDFIKDLQNHQLDADTADRLKQLGLDPGMKTYNVDITKYLNTAAVNPTIANAASQDQFSRYQALQQLANNPSQNIFGSATQAEAYDPYNFDRTKFTTDIQNAQNYYEKELPQQALAAAKKQLSQWTWSKSGASYIQNALDNMVKNNPNYSMEDITDALKSGWNQRATQGGTVSYNTDPRFRGSSWDAFTNNGTTSRNGVFNDFFNILGEYRKNQNVLAGAQPNDNIDWSNVGTVTGGAGKSDDESTAYDPSLYLTGK